MAPHDHGAQDHDPHEHDREHTAENPETGLRPFDEAAPVFDEPWQAQALALADELKKAGHFTATEWAEALGAERARQAASGAPDTNQAYFEAVVTALERLTSPTIPAEARARRRAAWEAAYLRTPHGQPVLLGGTD